MNRIALLWHYAQARRQFTRWKNRADLEAWQEAQVVRHANWVVRKSPFFAEHFGKIPPSQWREISLTGKALLMANFDHWNTVGISEREALEVAVRAEQSRNFTPAVRGITVGLSSGTSGSRGLFLASAAEQSCWSGTLLARVLQGTLLRRHRAALFLRADSNLYQSLGSRRFAFRFFDLQRPLHEHWQPLDAYRPTLLAAPPAVLRALANLPLAANLMAEPGLILSVADVLDPQEQNLLETSLRRPVGQIYQATEGFLAATCPHGHLHWNEDCLILEKQWLDADKTRYHPVITDFRRQSQPILRYLLNDVIQVHPQGDAPCPCGSLFQRLGRIEGRSDEILHLPNLRTNRPEQIFPDFVRRALILALPLGVEYTVRQTQPTHWEITLSDLSQAPQVTASLQALATEFHCQAPSLSFAKWVAPAGDQKRRRIVAEC